MSQVAESALAGVRGLFNNWPRWVQVVLFLVLALCMALAGHLDDWVRAIGAVCFAGLALTLVAGIRQDWHASHPLAPVPDQTDVGPQPPED